MICNFYEPLEIKREINLVIGTQGQCRAGKKDSPEVNKLTKRRLTSPQASCFVDYLPGKNL
jgi:hypothetical protein